MSDSGVDDLAMKMRILDAVADLEKLGEHIMAHADLPAVLKIVPDYQGLCREVSAMMRAGGKEEPMSDKIQPPDLDTRFCPACGGRDLESSGADPAPKTPTLDATDVLCPSCGAAPGELCTRWDEAPIPSHPARRRVARAAKNPEEDNGPTLARAFGVDRQGPEAQSSQAVEEAPPQGRRDPEPEAAAAGKGKDTGEGAAMDRSPGSAVSPEADLDPEEEEEPETEDWPPRRVTREMALDAGDPLLEGWRL